MEHKILLHLQFVDGLASLLPRTIFDVLTFDPEADADELGVDSADVQLELFRRLLYLVFVPLFGF